MAKTTQLKIRHVTTYDYDVPVHYALQQLRLKPRDGKGQAVKDWSLTLEGATAQVAFLDHFLNATELFKVDHGATQIKIVSEGLVEVEDTAGVVGPHRGYAPLWLFEAQTENTMLGPELRDLAKTMKEYQKDVDNIALLHALSAEIRKRVAYVLGVTNTTTSAEDALASGEGVCQDHAHIMISIARELGFPARYVSGYLLMTDRIEQEATHAWCEVHVPELGWVGFDVSNGISPDHHNVRIATGRDYRDAAPILGIRQGAGEEKLQVRLQVQQ
ncbi:transglutaminase family protein [Cognatishimia maritima]|uniref:Transglutaminase-like enzyme, putative cysteine protease n=1 Tax=Cognatishimia maritima TaxID=870908 RepID=A0A1M5QKW5_9RHOB|nr:transglutaminase family protein [Cognatishimia maritima]SHH14576.1 Transglutaminase-like enzyme, putative cysteine protease [Cognatishimia maritima]